MRDCRQVRENKIREVEKWDKMTQLILSIRATKFAGRYKQEMRYKNSVVYFRSYYGQPERVIIVKERVKNYKVIYLPAINKKKEVVIKKLNYQHEITAYINEEL